MWKVLILVSLILLLIPEGHSESVLLSQNVVLHNQYGQLTTKPPNQQYGNFTLYANGTMFFDYRSWESPVGIFSFTAQSYGNGTLVLRFKGIQPTQVTQSAATSAYSVPNRWQQITYTASQASPLTIIFTTNPRFSLQAGAFFGAAILIFVVIVRTLYVATANDSEERKKRIDQNRIIFIVMGLVVASLWIFSLLFP